MKKMKNTILICWCLVGAIFACQPDVDPVKDTDPNEKEPVVFPVGAAKGPQTTFSVTAAGGTFVSPDKTVKLIVPAGAVTDPLQITLQPVENTAPAGIGTTFRLTPHDIRFAKPVTIEMSYAAIAENLSSTTFLSLAYQNEKGHWIFTGKSVVNTAAKTIAVQTTHFSDWVIAEEIRLTPSVSNIGAGEEVTLEALTFSDKLTPLVRNDDSYMLVGVLLDSKYIKGNGGPAAWQLGGDGELHSAVNKATYIAPGQMLEPMTANVTLELFDKENPQTQHFLVSTIHVSTDVSLRYRLNGGPWQEIPNALVTEVGPGQYGLASIDDPIRVAITWEGGVGTHRWNTVDDDRPEYVTSAGVQNIGTLLINEAYYETPDGIKTSPGGVTITKLDKMKRRVEGTFRIDKSGLFSGHSGDQVRLDKVEGQFTAYYQSMDEVPGGRKPGKQR